ncbi:hypothetical protein [Verrucosispora sp. TAA-831]|uniref:hypothetical protein n=1 Tax=Verrucosispora sp. TAA-831 TaxID=3422227 RepID=UPI003D6F836B
MVGAARGSRKLDVVRELGADVVVDYSEPDWTTRSDRRCRTGCGVRRCRRSDRAGRVRGDGPRRPFLDARRRQRRGARSSSPPRHTVGASR